MKEDRAEGVPVAHPLFHREGGGSTPTSALALFFHKTDRDTFAGLNLRWHSTLPKIGASQFRACYAAEFDGRLWAVAAWSNPVARLLPQVTWLELRRYAIGPGAPKNTASRMLAWMSRDVRRRFPALVRLISYQDLDAHTGTIYKAAGWRQAPGYKSRARRGASKTTGWGSRQRAGRTGQVSAPRMRWELDLK